jgi:hypothetical protein
VDGRLLGRPNDDKPDPPTEIHLVYSNVQFNGTIRPEEFAFSAPANANVEDITEMITRSLDARIAQQALQKRAEAAKTEGGAEDSTLGQPLEVPAPASPANPIAPKGE